LINTINGIIERTHRLTGMPREQVYDEGFLLKKLALYGLGGATLAPTIGYGLSALPKNNDTLSNEQTSWRD
jgi:hypothetical protein